MTKIKDNIAYNSKTGIIEKKLSKNKKIMIWSGLGLTALTVSVSLPFGFLTNFNSSQGVITSPIDKPYNPQIVLSDSDRNTNFKAYYVNKWQNMFFKDININLVKDASDPVNSITLQNLANIGIVPNEGNDNWMNWQRVRSAPILNKTNQFQIKIQTSIIEADVFSYDVVLVSGTQNAIKPSTSYNPNIFYFNDNSSLIAYKPTSLTKLSDFYLTYKKDSQDGNGITLENLEKIGIVPIFDGYKTWTQITLFPINATTVKVTINTGNNATPIKAYNIINLPPSTLYEPTTSIYTATDNSFVAYNPNLVKENFLVDLSIEYTKSNSNQDLLINYNNLAKIGILPLSNDYKLWESIKLQPINSTEVKVIVNTSATNSFNYNVTGFKKSTFYDANTVVYNSNPNFIMYLPNNWKDLYPVQGKLTLTNTSSDANTKISLVTLEKIGIVPITSDYLTWTNIDITPTGGGTCTVVIKKSETNIVATIVANRFKTSGTYGTTILHKELNNTNYNFIWYKPTAWNNVWANTIDINLEQQRDITLASLEAIGIVPLSDSYKSWTSVKKTATTSNNDITLDGLQGSLELTITNSTSGVAALATTVKGFNSSSIYDPFNVLEKTGDYIRFLPVAFKGMTSQEFLIYRNISWHSSRNELNKMNLEKLGIVPLNENYSTWISLICSSNVENKKVTFELTTAVNTSKTLSYPITITN